MGGLNSLQSKITTVYDSKNIERDFNVHADGINYITKSFSELDASFDFKQFVSCFAN